MGLGPGLSAVPVIRVWSRQVVGSGRDPVATTSGGDQVVSLTVGSIVAIVLGVLLFAESIALCLMVRKQRAGRFGRR